MHSKKLRLRKSKVSKKSRVSKKFKVDKKTKKSRIIKKTRKSRIIKKTRKSRIIKKSNSKRMLKNRKRGGLLSGLGLGGPSEEVKKCIIGFIDEYLPVSIDFKEKSPEILKKLNSNLKKINLPLFSETLNTSNMNKFIENFKNISQELFPHPNDKNKFNQSLIKRSGIDIIINWDDYMDITPVPPNRFQQEINDKKQEKLLEKIMMNNNPFDLQYQIHRCFLNNWDNFKKIQDEIFDEVINKIKNSNQSWDKNVLKPNDAELKKFQSEAETILNIWKDMAELLTLIYKNFGMKNTYQEIKNNVFKIEYRFGTRNEYLLCRINKEERDVTIRIKKENEKYNIEFEYFIIKKNKREKQIKKFNVDKTEYEGLLDYIKNTDDEQLIERYYKDFQHFENVYKKNNNLTLKSYREINQNKFKIFYLFALKPDNYEKLYKEYEDLEKNLIDEIMKEKYDKESFEEKVKEIEAHIAYNVFYHDKSQWEKKNEEYKIKNIKNEEDPPEEADYMGQYLYEHKDRWLDLMGCGPNKGTSSRPTPRGAPPRGQPTRQDRLNNRRGPSPRGNLSVSGQKMELQQRPQSSTPKKPKQKTKQSNKAPPENTKSKEERLMEKIKRDIDRERYEDESNAAFDRSRFMGF